MLDEHATKKNKKIKKTMMCSKNNQYRNPQFHQISSFDICGGSFWQICECAGKVRTRKWFDSNINLVIFDKWWCHIDASKC